MKVAISQMKTRAGNFGATVDRMIIQSNSAAHAGADVLVFPAPVLTGPNMGIWAQGESYMQDQLLALYDLSEKLACPALIPFGMLVNGVTSYELLYLAGGEVHPIRYTIPAGETEFSLEDISPEGPLAFSLGEARMVVAFSRDDLDAIHEMDESFDLVLYLQTEGFCIDDPDCRLAPAVADGAFVRDASTLNSWLVAVGPVGAYDETVYTGGSFVMAPWGELAAVLPSFEEDFQVVEVALDSEGPLDNAVHPSTPSRYDFFWDALVAATRSFLEHDGTRRDCVIALDGSLASAATATLLVDALGPMLVHPLVVDTGDAAALNDARELARNLRLEPVELTLSQSTRAAHSFGVNPENDELKAALILARLSMLALEHHAQCISSADKTALALESESVTKEPAVYAPFGDVYRSDVLSLAQQRMHRSSTIPASSFERRSVPKLTGTSYAGATTAERINAIDAALLMHIEFNQGIEALIASGNNHILVDALVERVRETEATRRSCPVYPVMSSRTVSEAAMPVDFAWKDHVRGYRERLRIEEAFRKMQEMHRQEQTQNDGSDLVERIADVRDMIQDIAISGVVPPQPPKGNQKQGGSWGSELFSDN